MKLDSVRVPSRGGVVDYSTSRLCTRYVAPDRKDENCQVQEMVVLI